MLPSRRRGRVGLSSRTASRRWPALRSEWNQYLRPGQTAASLEGCDRGVRCELLRRQRTPPFHVHVQCLRGSETRCGVVPEPRNSDPTPTPYFWRENYRPTVRPLNGLTFARSFRILALAAARPRPSSTTPRGVGPRRAHLGGRDAGRDGCCASTGARPARTAQSAPARLLVPFGHVTTLGASPGSRGERSVERAGERG